MEDAPGPTQHYLQRISHRRIDPPALTGQTPLAQAIDEAFLSYTFSIFFCRFLAPSGFTG
jgi:hypothetical protein